MANVRSAMLLVAAFEQGRGELLNSAFDDRFHQPYRAPLCPLLPALSDLGGQHGILGVALSGAGPSVLLVTDAKAKPVSVQRAIRAQLRKRGLEAELLQTRIADKGASQ